MSYQYSYKALKLLGEAEKKRSHDSLDELVRECPKNQWLMIGGDLNGHVGAEPDGYSGVHKGFKYEVRNEEGRTISWSLLRPGR
ncbi:hypothetical protein CTI12_AA155830 [Artemisia annua]|uniref:Uncharacterized protein n=1 Tax=Artemisia annua TaxID=35608 RepID=A0A2U1PGC7_ARTAN|nr:hypothetical protein CTI12_AA155830 [Artemisia annua]